jgi:hypothetical protein
VLGLTVQSASVRQPAVHSNFSLQYEPTAHLSAAGLHSTHVFVAGEHAERVGSVQSLSALHGQGSHVATWPPLELVTEAAAPGVTQTFRDVSQT